MATITSTFTGTEATLSESGLWETAAGALGPMQKVDRARATNADTHSSARATTPAIGAAQYAQANMYWAFDRGGVGVAVRLKSGADSSGYIGYGIRDGAVWNSGFAIKEYDSSGNDTELVGTTSTTPTSGNLLRLEVDASHNFTLKEGATTRLGPTSDASPVTTGQPGIGIRRNTGSAASDLELDNFEGGDLGGSETITMDKWLGNAAILHRRKVGVVPSGTIGIKA